MATGLIAAVGSSSTFTYTAPTNCKMILNACADSTSANITLNGVSIFQTAGLLTQSFNQIPLYLAGSQIINISTGSNSTILISSYEE